MLIRASHGRNRADRRPLEQIGAWSEFCAIWEAYAQIDRQPADKDLTAPFISPFILRLGAIGKTKPNVAACGAWFGADIDTAGWTMTALVALFAPYPYCIHTTTKSRPDHQRFRVLFRISRELADEAEHLGLWHFVNEMVGGTVDVSTKNINRLLFVPARWAGADNLFECQTTGTPLDVDVALAWAQARGVPTTTGGIDSEPLNAIVGDATAGPLVTACMEQSFRTAPEGGRFYRLLVGMAARAKENGWAITSEELIREALALDRIVTGKKRDQPLREASRALAWANAHVRGLTDLEQLQRRLCGHTARLQRFTTLKTKQKKGQNHE
jgi:hypothetical protein